MSFSEDFEVVWREFYDGVRIGLRKSEQKRQTVQDVLSEEKLQWHNSGYAANSFVQTLQSADNTSAKEFIDVIDGFAFTVSDDHSDENMIPINIGIIAGSGLISLLIAMCSSPHKPHTINKTAASTLNTVADAVHDLTADLSADVVDVGIKSGGFGNIFMKLVVLVILTAVLSYCGLRFLAKFRQNFSAKNSGFDKYAAQLNILHDKLLAICRKIDAK